MPFAFCFYIVVSKHRFREVNRTVASLEKKWLISLYSRILWSNFPKDITNISFHDYYGFLSNCVCKFLFRNLLS